MVCQNGEEFEILIYSLVHAFHIPQVEGEILEVGMPKADLSLEEDEGADLRNYVLAELAEEAVYYLNVEAEAWREVI